MSYFNDSVGAGVVGRYPDVLDVIFSEERGKVFSERGAVIRYDFVNATPTADYLLEDELCDGLGVV